MVEKTKHAFVICPIGQVGSDARKHSDMVYNAVLMPVFEPTPYQLTRADLMGAPGIITNDVVNAIVNSDVCIADLTGLNANVFYELGIAHSAKRPTIHIASSSTTLPFDNLGYRAILFDPFDWHSQEGARSDLKSHLASIEVPGFKVSNPVTSARAEFEIAASDDPQKQAMHDVFSRLTAIEARLPHAALPAARSSEVEFDETRATAVAIAVKNPDASKLLMSLVRRAGPDGYIKPSALRAAVAETGWGKENWSPEIEVLMEVMGIKPSDAVATALRSNVL